MGGSENPIFYDKNGKRWVRTKIIVLFILALCSVLVYWAIPQVFSHKQVHATSIALSQNSARSGAGTATVAPSVDELTARLSVYNTPVIGKGSLVRAVQVVSEAGQKNITDPFTGKFIRSLSVDEVAYLGEDMYAIERYGHTGSSKRIALTFDDGPHPIYTPQLLDILSRESARATFFVVGSNVTRYPEITQRIAREGHTLGNHTFTHSEFEFASAFQNEQEINQSDRLISAVTGYTTSFFRIPYGGHTDQSIRNTTTALLTAQKMGYTVASYDFDSNDWRFPDGHEKKYPAFDGEDKIVLVHDSGGDRTTTVAYVQELITRAKAQGYTFVNLADMYPQVAPAVAPSQSSIIDEAVLMVAKAALVWPRNAITGLFAISITSIILTTFANIILALRQRAKAKRQYARYVDDYNPLVSIIVPAYNESMVLTRAVYSLLESTYEHIEILIVDDGSTDDTWDIARMFEAQHENVTAIRQINGGKSSALNNAIGRANGEIMICVDADTIFPSQTVGKFVRHFQDPTVGAVAGVVKVGNVQGIITKWQALEYTLSIAIERNAQAYLGSIMIIPGACGAWRKSAVLEAGGYSHSTLAEDCDLTLTVQKLLRYKILQDNEAISYTEAPQKIKSLIKQRFRWTFGSIQALWKHHDMMFERDYGWLGSFVMPNAVISIAIPLFFWPLLMLVSLQNILAGNYQVILLYFIISLTLQFLIATVGLLMMRERLAYLVVVPFARFIYGPIRAYVLYRTVLTALMGSYVGWNKLVRTGSASYLQKSKISSAPH